MTESPYGPELDQRRAWLAGLCHGSPVYLVRKDTVCGTVRWQGQVTTVYRHTLRVRTDTLLLRFKRSDGSIAHLHRRRFGRLRIEPYESNRQATRGEAKDGV
jgi:hypothetical protein